MLLKPSGGSSVRPVRAYRSRTVVEHGAGVAADRLMEDGRQRGAGVFDIDVDVAGEQRAIADQRAAEIQPAIDRQAGVALDRLRQQLAEHQLLGEVLRADDDRAAGAARRQHRRRAAARGSDRRGGDRRGAARARAGGAPTAVARATAARRRRRAPAPRPEWRRRGSPSCRPSTARDRCIRRGRRRRSPRQSSPSRRRRRPRRARRRRSTAAPAAARPAAAARAASCPSRRPPRGSTDRCRAGRRSSSARSAAGRRGSARPARRARRRRRRAAPAAGSRTSRGSASSARCWRSPSAATPGAAAARRRCRAARRSPTAIGVDDGHEQRRAGRAAPRSSRAMRRPEREQPVTRIRSLRLRHAAGKRVEQPAHARVGRARRQRAARSHAIRRPSSSTPTRSRERERLAHVVRDDDHGLAQPLPGCGGTRRAARRASADRARRTARPSAAPADRPRARAPRRPAGAARRTARRASAPRTAPAAARRAPAARRTRARYAPARPPLEPRHDRDVVGDRHVREQADLLHHVADAASQPDRIPLARVAALRRARRRRPASSSRLMSFRSVLLPAPLRPTSASTSPASTVRLKRSRTRTPPGRANDTSRNSIAGAGIAFATVHGGHSWHRTSQPRYSRSPASRAARQPADSRRQPDVGQSSSQARRQATRHSRPTLHSGRQQGEGGGLAREQGSSRHHEPAARRRAREPGAGPAARRSEGRQPCVTTRVRSATTPERGRIRTDGEIRPAPHRTARRAPDARESVTTTGSRTSSIRAPKRTCSRDDADEPAMPASDATLKTKI